MKKQKAVSILATLSILSFAVACNDGGGGATADRYAEGFAAGKVEGKSEGKTEGYNLGKTDGYKEGYDKGYDDGDKDGYARAEAYFKTADYSKGFNDGKSIGLATGYTQGYVVGKSDGKKEGYDLGYNDGYDDGEDHGYDVGYDDGYLDGKDFGLKAGYDIGYDDGYDDGYDTGFDDGYASLSVGKSPKLKGYADVISAFHNDLIDYSKIKAPKETKRGLVANGQLLFSEASLTNKDTLKRAAVVEQYLVVEMSKQVQAKFGLSANRSLKIAKAANHFRKASTSRAFTSEDTNAYAREIIGADFNKISKAYESSLKGDLSDLNSLLKAAAEKNETTPEKMGEIVTKMFL
jgi:flagellar biosynthesis/type III secretory pathway protein FliH